MSTSPNRTIAAGDAPWPDIIAWDNSWIDRMNADADALPPEPRERAFSWLTIINHARQTNDSDLMAFAIGQVQDIVRRRENV